MATISGQECQAWRSERYYNINNLMLEMVAKGKRVPKENVPILSERESLISKTRSKAIVVSHDEVFAPEFKKYAGKYAPTDKIFEKVIGKTAKNETELSA